jgi:hypothetical protein
MTSRKPTQGIFRLGELTPIEEQSVFVETFAPSVINQSLAGTSTRRQVNGTFVLDEPPATPTVFSFGPRCQGLLPGAVRVSEVDRDAGGDGELGVAAHFAGPRRCSGTGPRAAW